MKPPVFIVGCPRSGTSFLYHLLLSAGGFAEFHTQMNVYDVLEPIYGDLGVPKNKEAAIQEWLRSKAFRVSGLEAAEIETKVLAECHCAGDFLRIIMEEVTLKQGVDRWIDSTPTNVPHMLRIQQDFRGRPIRAHHSRCAGCCSVARQARLEPPLAMGQEEELAGGGALLGVDRPEGPAIGDLAGAELYRSPLRGIGAAAA